MHRDKPLAEVIALVCNAVNSPLPVGRIGGFPVEQPDDIVVDSEDVDIPVFDAFRQVVGHPPTRGRISEIEDPVIGNGGLVCWFLDVLLVCPFWPDLTDGPLSSSLLRSTNWSLQLAVLDNQ